VFDGDRTVDQSASNGKVHFHKMLSVTLTFAHITLKMLPVSRVYGRPIYCDQFRIEIISYVDYSEDRWENASQLTCLVDHIWPWYLICWPQSLTSSSNLSPTAPKFKFDEIPVSGLLLDIMLTNVWYRRTHVQTARKRNASGTVITAADA